jgi:hypothetical protein
MNCPNCGSPNEENYKFCLKCGQPLSPDGAGAMIKTSAPAQQLQRTLAQARAIVPHPTAYGGSGNSPFNIWGPFAGYGTRRRHVGWLMDNQGLRATELIDKVNANFDQRQIPGVYLSHLTLVAQGISVEKRPYFLLRRGLASIGLYIAQFGQDLFVSLVSYLKPPVSTFRVLILVLMLFFQTFMTFGYPLMLSDEVDKIANSFSLFSSGTPDMSGLLSLVCLVGPLGTVNTLALLFFLIYSLYKWLTEKDIWAGLRVPPNEFNEDDLMAMEKAVEQTVRLSLDEIGLNPDDLIPTAVGSSRRLI